MAATAEERIPALNSSEDIFSLAVPFAACSENRIGENAPEGQKSHQGIFSKNRTIAVGATRAKWSGTHQDSGRWWPKTVLEIAIDANGNTLSDASGRSFTWDFENRLTQVVNPGVGTTTFRYDPVGRRIQKSGPLGATNYLYDRMNDIEEVDNAVNVLSRYTFGGLDQPLSQVRSGTTSYYQGDAQGTVTSLSNPAGAESNTYTYDSFGKLTASTGSITNPFQYTGREFDSETGLFFNRARYLDPSSGRFLSEDPLQFDGGINFFRYVGNRPTKFTDAFGLQQQCDKKSCGIDQAPEYDVNGSAPGGTTFHWNAVFKNDSTHDPKCSSSHGTCNSHPIKDFHRMTSQKTGTKIAIRTTSGMAGEAAPILICSRASTGTAVTDTAAMTHQTGFLPATFCGSDSSSWMSATVATPSTRARQSTSTFEVMDESILGSDFGQSSFRLRDGTG